MKRNYNPEIANEAFKTLQNSRAREALSHLETQEPKDLDDIIDDLEEDSDQEIDKDRYKVILHHTALPTLEEAGFVQKEEDGQGYVLSMHFPDSSASDYAATGVNDKADEIFEMFASEDRRLILSYMNSNRQQAEKEDLVRYVSDNTEEFDQRSSTEIQIRLDHLHLPKLDEADFIRYDKDSKEVEGDDMLYDNDVQMLLDSLYGEAE